MTTFYNDILSTTGTVTIDDVSTIDVSGITLGSIYYDPHATSDATSVITISGYDDEPEKRHSLRDNGSIPFDIWAKMFNKGILND